MLRVIVFVSKHTLRKFSSEKFNLYTGKLTVLIKKET